MQIERTALSGVLVLHPRRHADERGFFSETYRRSELARAGIHDQFVQDNHSRSGAIGTIRGLHFQIPPWAQAKLVRVSRGAIFDVVVDVRQRSPTYGRHVVVHLSAEKWNQLYVPVGFAHGLCTLEANTEVQYKVSAEYSQDHERGVLWNDPALGIAWPVPESEAQLSGRDRGHPPLSELPAYFTIDAPA
jgi:dTDP-4-dehydrorhamnose 3,5-epimerase